VCNNYNNDNNHYNNKVIVNASLCETGDDRRISQPRLRRGWVTRRCLSLGRHFRAAVMMDDGPMDFLCIK